MTATADAASTTNALHGVRGRAQASWPAALAGAVSASLALGTAELAAGLIGPIPSLLYAIGGGVVELGAGTPVKDVAIALFGTREKTALVIGTVILSLVIGGGLGRLAQRWFVPAAAGFVAFGALGVLATTVSPLDSTTWAVPAAVAAAGAGVAALRFLIDLDARIQAAAADLPAGGSDEVGALRATRKVGRERREFIRVSLGLAAVAGASGMLGRSLVGRSETSAARDAVLLPEAAATAPVVASGTSFTDIDDLSPLFTPNDRFYRIDTALMAPVVDVASWTMRVHGMVDREVVMTYDELLAMGQMEADVTISCVSNEVGGDLIGNARWQGVRLSDVLDLAGVDPDTATQLVGRAVDGWTAGFPTGIAFDGRDAMIAVAMNGAPLPVDHGFPARLIVPGLYGYVSATKWLSDIELTTWEAFDGYWVPRGWAKEGPIKTQSRIDVPRQRASVPPGEMSIAGVAWAQRRGVAKVEISVDDGPWEEAELAEELSVDTWRQWRHRWEATPGEHTVRVRATDGEGVTQSETRVPVAPDGAEGYHSRLIRVS